MKKILLLLFLFASIHSFGQFPNTVTSGNSSTLQKSNGAYGAMIGYVFAGTYGDTTAANLSFIKNVPGIVIRISDDLWMRNNAVTAWIKIGSGGATGTFVDSVTTNSDSTILRYWVAGSSYDFYNFKTGLTGGDTTIFQTVIDSTAQSGQKILWGANNKIRSSPYLLFDSANRKIVIGNQNISVGGPNTKLWVTGNANITGNITANSFIKTGGTSSQFLKADGSVDNNTYIKPADTTNKWVGSVYKRLDSFFYKTGTTEYFIGKDSTGSGASTAAGVTPAIQLKDISSTRYAYLNRSITDGGESSPSIPAYNFQTLNSFTIPSDWWDGTSLHNLGDTALVLRLGWKTAPTLDTDSMYVSKDGGVTWSFLGLFPYKVHSVSHFKTLDGKFIFIGGDFYSSNADNQKVTVTNDFTSFTTKTTSSPFTRRVLFSSFEGYDGAWYAVGGQANTTGDTLYNDAYRSLDSGATWSLWANQLHSGSDSIGGGNAYGQIIPFNGFYVSVGVGVYKATQKHTRKCYISPDVKTWYAIDDMPWAADYKAVWVNDGKLWVFGGNDSTGNTNNLAYLDKSFHWHSVPNYQGTDKTTVLPTSHAQAATVYRGDAILSVGNQQNKTIRLYRDIYQSAANFRDTIKVNGRTYVSQVEGAHTSFFGNGVRAGASNNTYVHTKPELGSYFAQSYQIGQWLGFTDSTQGVEVPQQNGMQVLLDIAGHTKLTNNPSFTLGTQKLQVDGKIAGNNTIESSFYANANPHLILSNTNGLFDWVTNGTANQVLTMNGTGTGFQFQTLSTLGASSFILNQNSTPQASANFYIDGNGRLANLGINTAPSVTYILDVNKSSGAQIARFANASSGLLLGADANGGYFQPTASGYGVWLYNGAGTTVFKVLGAGGFSLTGGVAKYSANYGGSYDARSLVDKNYVDSADNKRVDTIYRTAGKDSIQFTIGGRYHAIKDSTGGSTPTLQQVTNAGSSTTLTTSFGAVKVTTSSIDRVLLQEIINGGDIGGQIVFKDPHSTNQAHIYPALTGLTGRKDFLLADEANTTSTIATREWAATQFPKNLSSQYTDAANSGTAETDLMSYTVPAGQLVNDGDRLEIEAYFTTSANADQKTLKFYFGAFSQTWTPSTIPSGTKIEVRLQIIRTSATTQRIVWDMLPLTGSPHPDFGSTTETLSGTILLKFTGTSDTASSDITQKTMTVTYYPAN